MYQRIIKNGLVPGFDFSLSSTYAIPTTIASREAASNQKNRPEKVTRKKR